ncbi:MAG: hypothetical protein ACRDZX_00890 [Acidimicrobiales bacterium]
MFVRRKAPEEHCTDPVGQQLREESGTLVPSPIVLVVMGGSMKWQIRLEVQVHGHADNVEAFIDDAMEHLVDSGIEDPTVGGELASGIAEVEFVVEASTLGEAQQIAHDIVAKTLGQPNGELIGESTRRALVPA